MGVYYSSSVGYGIAFKSEDAPVVFNGFNLHEDGEVSEWLEENNLSEIGYDYCGNWMSGPMVCFFYLKGTVVLNTEVSDLEIINEFSEGAIDEFNAEQLYALRAKLNMPDLNIGWKLISNVN